jgi:pyruvate kinase
MQDLCGPKIRVSQIGRPDFTAEEGELIRLTTDQQIKASDGSLVFDLASTYDALLDDVATGDRILLDDGRIELSVKEHHGATVSARVVRGGPVSVGKGINLPGVALSTESVTEKDWLDLQWAVKHEVDFVALSFVRHPEDVARVQSFLVDAGSDAGVIAKIERPEALESIDEIIQLADGLMVARGDLGLETDLAGVPLLQKHLIKRCREACKPVITATQMLESMIHNAMPTRAEVSDVANAICDGTDAIMLSGETAAGRFPIEAVRVLDRVARVTEADISCDDADMRRQSTSTSSADAMVDGAAVTARALDARRLVAYSQTGATARMLARHRLSTPVAAVTNREITARQLNLSYGVEPIYLPQIMIMPHLLHELDRLASECGWGEAGDTVVVVSALDGQDGNTDTLHLHRIGPSW